MKHNYRVARRVYSSIYTNTAEQFKIYVNSILPNEINETKNGFQANGNELLSFQDTKCTTELFDSLTMFYYIMVDYHILTDIFLFLTEKSPW